MKKAILQAMYVALKTDTESKLATGEYRPPLNAANVVAAAWIALIEGSTASTVSLLGITKDDIEKVVNRVYKELKCG